jgi:hypothetical protein
VAQSEVGGGFVAPAADPWAVRCVRFHKNVMLRYAMARSFLYFFPFWIFVDRRPPQVWLVSNSQESPAVSTHHSEVLLQIGFLCLQ